MKEYFKRRADEIDEVLDNHPAYGNRLNKENTEEYPHRHSTADWKPELISSEEVPDNIIPFRYKDKNN